ncbi:MAG: ribonuclease HII [Parcubacteria group bacterium]|nr:ribonuclease HII [Parcubacteria group bacterium]
MSEYEIKLKKQGFKAICGVDEVGLGPWAGPVAFGAVILPIELIEFPFRDSKLLTHKKRENIYEELKDLITWNVAIVSSQELDELGLSKAKILAFKRVIMGLSVKPDIILVDGRYLFKNGPKPKTPCEFIIDGDDKVKSISAASIFAKVYRDRIMIKLHKKYPEYCFDKNKGYGTREHREALEKHGICEIHRKSYKPIERILKDCP